MIDGFFQKVYRAVASIPPGYVMTYGDIASIAGNPRAARAVGFALCSPSARGLEIPWHRVVNARGEISLRRTVNGEADGCLQRILLEDEGIVFDSSGRLSLEKYGIVTETPGL